MLLLCGTENLPQLPTLNMDAEPGAAPNPELNTILFLLCSSPASGKWDLWLQIHPVCFFSKQEV